MQSAKNQALALHLTQLFLIIEVTTLKRYMKNFSAKLFSSLLSLLILTVAAEAHDHSDKEIRYVQQKQAFDVSMQQHLKATTFWYSFSQKHPSWHVLFNEENGKPNRAFGDPIRVSGSDLVAKSYRFMAEELHGFNIPVGQLELIRTHESAKYRFVNFRQLHEGLEIINSRLTLKFTKTDEVVLFGLDVFNNIQLSTVPSISEGEAMTLAQHELENITHVYAEPQLKVLAIPGNQQYSFRLVRTIFVETIDHDRVPENWEVLVDAHNGQLLSRRNLVVQAAPKPFLANGRPEANGNLQLLGTIYPKHPYLPDSMVALPHLQFTVNGVNYFTTASGQYDGGIPGLPALGTFPLQGRWSRVVHGNTGSNTPTFTLMIDSLRDTVIYNNRGTSPAINSIRHLSAYYHTSLVHDYLKSLMPNFTALDFPLTTRVDRTDGTCNAFFNGNSINFYVTAGGCNALSLTADVVYHEYGHAITNYFYNSFGQPFQNGGMGEGYSDIFAITLTNDPVLGIGFSSTNPNTFIRRYDINPKIFPQNLVGQVHADGEIICGAWWRTGGLIGNNRTMMEILAESMYALANAPNGQEGRLYSQILIDAIQADDDDNNLSNGTPHFNQLVSAFGFHGIRLLANVQFTLTPFADAPANAPIPVNVSINAAAPFNSFVAGAQVIYRPLGAAPSLSDTVTLTSAGGNNYTGSLPAQPAGTILQYFVGVVDLSGGIGTVQPNFATDAATPNLHYNLLVGFTEYANHTFENASQDSTFTIGFSTDNATDGFWEMGVPIPSFATAANPSSITAPGSNATPGGSRAAFTKNAPASTSPVDAADVDGGRTSLLSPFYDLSTYGDPVITYMRWYTNETGSSPNLDNWEVYITNDGSTWRLVERTRRSDRSWRRNAVRVRDFVTPSATVRLRFVAQDLNPASIVEAAIDDIRFFDLTPATGVNGPRQELQVQVFPNPTKGALNVSVYAQQSSKINFQVSNTLGQVLMTENHALDAGFNQLNLQLQQLPAGIYLLRIDDGQKQSVRRIIRD
jgi:hypothetical protein